MGTAQRPAANPCPEPSSAGSALKRPVTGRRASPGGCRSPRRSGGPILGVRRGEKVPAILYTPRGPAMPLAPPPPPHYMPCVTVGPGLIRNPGRLPAPSKGLHADPTGARARRLHRLLCPIRRLSPKRVAFRPSLASCTCLSQNQNFKFAKERRRDTTMTRRTEGAALAIQRPEKPDLLGNSNANNTMLTACFASGRNPASYLLEGPLPKEILA